MFSRLSPLASVSQRTWKTAASTATSGRFISSSKLTIELTQNSKLDDCPPKEDLQFGAVMSDHMLIAEWNKGEGWGAPRIVPYQNLSLSPAATSLQYGLQCFEGLKAYKTLGDGSIRLFRTDKNVERLKTSMDRLQMGGIDFDTQELVDCIAKFVSVEKDWIPEGEGYSLYLRPTVVSSHATVRVASPTSLILYVIASPVGPYYKGGFKPVRLTCDTPFVRAWPGGTGAAKVGGNYGPTMKPASNAEEDGYSQVLWLFGEDDQITEVGAMNVFFFLVNKETGRKELVTPPLSRGDILPGVTRSSILELARGWGEFDVSEREITMGEVKEAANDSRLLEVFGAGTAAVVAPVECIQYQGEDIDIPAVGDVTNRVWDEVTGIQYGKVEGPEGWSIKVE